MTANNVIATSLNQLYALYEIEAILQQIYINLALITEGASGQEIAINNTSLYTVAAQYYKDATKWTVIAEANGLTDPMVNGTMTITVPINGIDSGGILNG